MRRVIHGAQGPVASPSPAVNAPIDPVSVAFAVNAGGQAVVRRPRSGSGPSSTSAGSSNRKPVMLSSVASGTSNAPIQSSVSSGGAQAAQLRSAVPASTKGSVAVPVRKLLKVKRAPVSSVVPPELETLPEAPAPTAVNATAAPFQPSGPWQSSTWGTTPLVALPAHRVKPLELPKFSGLEKDFLRCIPANPTGFSGKIPENSHPSRYTGEFIKSTGFSKNRMYRHKPRSYTCGVL